MGKPKRIKSDQLKSDQIDSKRSLLLLWVTRRPGIDLTELAAHVFSGEPSAIQRRKAIALIATMPEVERHFDEVLGADRVYLAGQKPRKRHHAPPPLCVVTVDPSLISYSEEQRRAEIERVRQERDRKWEEARELTREPLPPKVEPKQERRAAPGAKTLEAIALIDQCLADGVLLSQAEIQRRINASHAFFQQCPAAKQRWHEVKALLNGEELPKPVQPRDWKKHYERRKQGLTSGRGSGRYDRPLGAKTLRAIALIDQCLTDGALLSQREIARAIGASKSFFQQSPAARQRWYEVKALLGQGQNKSDRLS